MLFTGIFFTGCAGRWQHFSSRDAFERHRFDGAFARLQKLYESGAIDAEQLTSRRQALVELQERLNREDAIRRASEPDPFPANNTTDCKSKDERHPRR